MKNKNQYYIALKEDNGQLNEIDLGEKLGFNEEETRLIIMKLLSEHKIEYIENGTCNYSTMKRSKGKNHEKS
ncbi:hypothetical protein GCM10027429_18010 [Marivirga atlantica]|jgi:hypothetical protein|uniref:Uncharacterized protein n=1 Tax=Marivirga atlantica TaxID=1548457 RepID=A0A937AF97_9BACT|nr:hypothetical protein [Marivirga atlantica]MBL0765419.1 hypothetical protein [Marivirga atlantica]